MRWFDHLKQGERNSKKSLNEFKMSFSSSRMDSDDEDPWMNVDELELVIVRNSDQESEKEGR